MHLGSSGLAELVMPTNLLGNAILRRTAEDELVGYLRYLIYDDAWLITDVFVVPHLRGFGIATSMLNELLEDALAGDVPVVLRVASNDMPGALDNEELLEWYRRHGFKPHASYREHETILVSS